MKDRNLFYADNSTVFYDESGRKARGIEFLLIFIDYAVREKWITRKIRYLIASFHFLV